MAVLRDLHKPPSEWVPAGCPLVGMMAIERRGGKDNPVIKKTLVEMDSPCFEHYKRMREHWMLNDCYRTSGPIQYMEGYDRVNF
mmetsp:Transcript_5370/g.3087  ORF Transcript_5370/g.3087 Transcript_5370/m.3087 type:complete len:84 (+) Transcript_5370:848-1099(+)